MTKEISLMEKIFERKAFNSYLNTETNKTYFSIERGFRSNEIGEEVSFRSKELLKRDADYLEYREIDDLSARKICFYDSIDGVEIFTLDLSDSDVRDMDIPTLFLSEELFKTLDKKEYFDGTVNDAIYYIETGEEFNLEGVRVNDTVLYIDVNLIKGFDKKEHTQIRFSFEKKYSSNVVEVTEHHLFFMPFTENDIPLEDLLDEDEELDEDEDELYHIEDVVFDHFQEYLKYNFRYLIYEENSSFAVSRFNTMMNSQSESEVIKYLHSKYPQMNDKDFKKLLEDLKSMRAAYIVQG